MKFCLISERHRSVNDCEWSSIDRQRIFVSCINWIIATVHADILVLLWNSVCDLSLSKRNLTTIQNVLEGIWNSVRVEVIRFGWSYLFHYVFDLKILWFSSSRGLIIYYHICLRHVMECPMAITKTSKVGWSSSDSRGSYLDNVKPLAYSSTIGRDDTLECFKYSFSASLSSTFTISSRIIKNIVFASIKKSDITGVLYSSYFVIYTDPPKMPQHATHLK